MKKKLPNIILIGIFIIGLSLLLYPTISDYWNSFHQTKAIAAYTENIANIDDDVYEKMWDEARAYNEELTKKKNSWIMTEEELEEYENIMDVSGTGIMGYIEIPSIDCMLPIYHGVDEKVLQIAIGHIEGSSLPVGGLNTHTVLSGHRGLPSARLFSDLDQLVVGDIFMLQILDETLTYEVDQILIVLPNDLDALQIEQGKDLCTLVTCTPYGVNSHRLLVRGHRIDNAEAELVRVTADAMQIDPVIVAPAVAVPILLILLIVLLVQSSKKKK